MNKRNFSADKEELLQTLARFDGNITVDDVTDSRSIKTHSKYHTFFLQVLLENVCRDIEPNEEKRELLFSEVCRRLSEAEFLNDSIVFDNLLPLRRKLAKQFFNFVKQIHHEVVPDPTQNNVTAESFLQDSDFSTKLDLQGRYEKNFEELEVIARGGFGVVCKARYKVTDHVYAVKKVIFKYKSDSAYLKVIREAKNIAALSHSNIVSYNNAWIECMPLHESGSDSSETSSGSEESDSENSEDQISQCSKDLGSFLGKENESPSFEICFSKNRSVEENTWQKKSNASVKFLRENYSFNGNAFASSSKDSRTNCYSDDSTLSISETGYQSKSETYNYVHKTSSWVNCFNVRLTLYIQMEYCDCDLRLWLDRRAEGKELPFEMDVMKIFKDILHGLAYIHSKGIIHRDLKPRNIFYSKESSVLKIGDFGLATLMSCTADDENGDVSSQHSANLGTVPYAAPEQIRYKTYDSKVDIYSLGIILIELLNKFSTEMELALAIKEIHRDNFPKDVEKTWPKHVNLVKNLVKKQPEDRMSAKEILSQLNSLENLESNEEIIRVNKEMFKINEVLKATVAEKDNEIVQLKALVEKLQNNQKDNEIIRLKELVEELQNKLLACLSKTQESGH